MKFPGYQIRNSDNGVILISCIDLDETELTPESDWMEGYPNSDPEEGLWLGRDLDAALNEVRRRLLG